MGIRRWVGAAIVVICIGMPLVESFDSWDQTLSDGNDSEINVVVVALCVGLALSTATTIVVTLLRSLAADRSCGPRAQSIETFVGLVRFRPLPTSSPPSTPLRI